MLVLLIYYLALFAPFNLIDFYIFSCLYIYFSGLLFIFILCTHVYILCIYFFNLWEGGKWHFVSLFVQSSEILIIQLTLRSKRSESHNSQQTFSSKFISSKNKRNTAVIKFLYDSQLMILLIGSEEGSCWLYTSHSLRNRTIVCWKQKAILKFRFLFCIMDFLNHHSFYIKGEHHSLPRLF